MDILILFYNTMWGFPLEFRKEDLPGGCVITTDRNLLAKADAVVFHLPDLPSVKSISGKDSFGWDGVWNVKRIIVGRRIPSSERVLTYGWGIIRRMILCILIMDRIMGRCWLRHGGKSLIRRRHVCLFRVI